MQLFFQLCDPKTNTCVRSGKLEVAEVQGEVGEFELAAMFRRVADKLMAAAPRNPLPDNIEAILAAQRKTVKCTTED